jgi:hypothetical protein
MSAFVFVDCYVSVAGQDLSDHAIKVTVGLPIALVGATRMGNTAEARMPGLEDGDVVIEWQQDFAASKVDAIAYAARKTPAAIVIRPIKGTVVGATNPEYRMTALADGYSPLGGAVGELAKTTTTFRNSDGVAPTRAVA